MGNTITFLIEVEAYDEPADVFPSIQARIEKHFEDQRGFTVERTAWKWGLIENLPLQENCEPFAMPPVLRYQLHGGGMHIITDVVDFTPETGMFRIWLDDDMFVDTTLKDDGNGRLYGPLMDWLKRKRQAILNNIYAEAFELGYQHTKNGLMPDDEPMASRRKYAAARAKQYGYVGSQVYQGDEILAFVNGFMEGWQSCREETAHA